MTDQDQSRDANLRLKRELVSEQAALNHKAADVVLPEPVAWMLGYQTMGGDVGWKLSFSQSGAGVCHRLKGEQFEQPLYTEQTVRALLAKGIKESLTTAPAVPQRCWCETCDTAANGWRTRMALCPTCGNKRCPRANHHDHVCTGSNAPGQPGSSWEHVKPAPSPPPKEQT